MKDFIKVKDLDQVVDLVKKSGILSDCPINKLSTGTLFVSGFSSTFKSTIIEKLVRSVQSTVHLITSPVKIIDGLNHYYFKDMPINSITHFYSQFYALYTLMNTNRLSTNYIVERGIWDYLYFLERFGFNHSSVKNLEELDIKAIVDRIFSLLDIYNYKILILKNESPKLQNIAVNSCEPTRRMCYKDVDEYKNYQDKYLNTILPIIDSYTNDTIKVSITDEVCQSLNI